LWSGLILQVAASAVERVDVRVWQGLVLVDDHRAFASNAADSGWVEVLALRRANLFSDGLSDRWWNWGSIGVVAVRESER
jgi:hypothetical protein